MPSYNITNPPNPPITSRSTTREGNTVTGTVISQTYLTPTAILANKPSPPPGNISNTVGPVEQQASTQLATSNNPTPQETISAPSACKAQTKNNGYGQELCINIMTRTPQIVTNASHMTNNYSPETQWKANNSQTGRSLRHTH
jgi:hypothetical protein